MFCSYFIKPGIVKIIHSVNTTVIFISNIIVLIIMLLNTKKNDKLVQIVIHACMTIL